MKKTLTLIFSLGLSFCMQAQQFDVDTIVKNGNPDNYINFVYLGDGYTENQMENLVNNVNTVNGSFFSRIPFSNYKNYFNAFAIKVISPASGIKHPRTATDCPSLSEFPTTNPDNYFSTTFDSYDIHRLVCPENDNALWNVVSENFPQYDQVLLIGNTIQYGGSGGAYAVGTMHSESVEIMLHEVGHSFAGLADEYWAGDVYAAEKPNMTNQSNATPGAVKWQQWLNYNGTDIYQHCCGGTSASWYKPHNNCQMEFLGRQFCPVCRQRIIERIYELVNPIVSYEPVNLSVAVNSATEFKLTELMQPEPNTLKVQWMLNGTEIAQNVNQITLETNQLIPDANVLEAVVTDTTDMLRVTPDFTHHINKVVWTINDGVAIDINGTLEKYKVKIYPNPASDLLHIEASGLHHKKGMADIKIYTVNGICVLSTQAAVSDAGFMQSIDVSHLAGGNYFIELQCGGSKDRFKVTIAP